MEVTTSQSGGLDLAYLLGLDEPSLRKEWIALAVLRLTTSLNPVKNATGSSFITGNSSGTMFLIYETNQVQGGNGANNGNIQSGTLGLNLPPNTTGRRINWIERR